METDKVEHPGKSETPSAPADVEFVAIQLSRVPERVDNVDLLERTLRAPVHRLEAVDVLSDRWARYPYCSSHARIKGGRALKAAEIACFASHVEALRHAATSGARATVVLEDDAVLRPGVDAEFARAQISQLPSDADLVSTVRLDCGKPDPSGDPIGWVRRHRRLPWGTSSLIIFPGTYRLLEPHLFPVPMPIDVLYSWAAEKGHLAAYAPAAPAQFWTHNGPFKSQLHVER